MLFGFCGRSSKCEQQPKVCFFGFGVLGFALSTAWLGCNSEPTYFTGTPELESLPQIGYLTGDSRFAEFTDYFQNLYSAIASKWTLLASQRQLKGEAPGSQVVVEFTLAQRGEVDPPKVVYSSAGEGATLICSDAIEASAPFDLWSLEMISDLGEEQTVKLTFVYR